MCKYLRFCRRYFADEDLWTKVCGRGFADIDLQRRKFGDIDDLRIQKLQIRRNARG